MARKAARPPQAKPAAPAAHHVPFTRWELRLYVSNWEPRSAAAWASLNELCEEYLPGLYRIGVVDLLANPRRSREDQIVAIPTVVRTHPTPQKQLIGKLSDKEKVLAALELRAAQPHLSARRPPRRR